MVSAHDPSQLSSSHPAGRSSRSAGVSTSPVLRPLGLTGHTQSSSRAMSTVGASNPYSIPGQPAPHRLTPFSAQGIPLNPGGIWTYSTLQGLAPASAGLAAQHSRSRLISSRRAYVAAQGSASMNASSIKAHKLLEVSPSSEEGERVAKLLEGSGFEAVRVMRNQNAALETAYTDCVRSMRRGPDSLDSETRQQIKSLRRRHGLPAVQTPFNETEVLLFHTTRVPGAYEAILETGLSNCYGDRGGMFGKGIYFADDLRKSSQYGKSRQVLVCRVALGDCVWVPNEARRQLGHGRGSDPNIVTGWDRCTAPRKHDCYKRFAGDTYFNSWCGQSDFNEFVVSRDVQVFPLYLVDYEPTETCDGDASGIASQTCPFAVPDFVVGYTDGIPVDPQRWGRMLGSLINEIKLMDDCLSMHKEFFTETIDLTGDETARRTACCDSGDVIELGDDDDEDFLGTGRLAKRLKADGGGTACIGSCSTDSGCVDLTNGQSSDDADVIVLDDIPAPQPSSPPALQAASPSKRSAVSAATSSSSRTIPLRRTALTVKQCSANPQCNICMEDWTPGEPVVSLPCCSNALFHDSANCFAPLLRSGRTMSGRDVKGVKCPFCKKQHGASVGSCPDGTLSIHYEREWITLVFKFSCGVSEDGKVFSGRQQVAYLPKTSEAREVVPFIEQAFDLRHCFRLGVSDTTGRYGICWGSLHFKTSKTGGAQYHGFPDATYVERLKDELAIVLGK